MTDEINTHDLIVDFGKHRGERWTRIPASYLRWLVNDANPVRGSEERKAIATAELKRRGISAADQAVEISGHAIDSASLRIRKTWHEDRGPDEGLHAWLLRICGEALEQQKPDIEGRIDYKGVRLVFLEGNFYPTLKTVMRIKRKIDDVIDIPDDLNQTPPILRPPSDDGRPPWEE